MLRLWSCLRRKPIPPKARSGPIPGRSYPPPVHLEVEQLEDRVVPTAVVGTGTGLLAQYFSDQTLTNLVLTRTDPSINFNLATNQAPAQGMPSTHWSARWTGLVQAQYSQTYTFTTLSDDGVRLFVNGQELINDWTDHSPRTDSATIVLQAGQQYAIEMDYYQDAYGATAQLLWSSPSTPQQVIPTSQLYVVSPVIDAGGSAAGSFIADTDFSGGSTYHTTATINTGSVTNPAPQVVYQTERYGNFTYSVPNLTPGASYSVRLDFAEIYWNAAGQRLFNVSIDGKQVLTNFDIFATAGGKDKAIAETFAATANSSGQIVLTFTAVKDTAKVDGIEITPVLSTPATGRAPVPDWFSLNLHDAALAQLARTDDVDGSLSRADMLQLFAYADKGSTVSSTDLADLRTLVANAAKLGMPGYVQDLTNSVVNGDPADASYLGKALPTLAAGSPGWVLQDLVNKWFLGLDLPALGTGTQYAMASGSLFGSGPNFTDVLQGSLSDCYFLAGLAEVAYRSPSTIQSMFINNGDGTYTVRFFNGSQADYVTVNLDLPETPQGTFAYANYQESISNGGNNLWVALAEKAYAELAASGWSRALGPPMLTPASRWGGRATRSRRSPASPSSCRP